MPKNKKKNQDLGRHRRDQSTHLKVGAEHKWEVEYCQTPRHTSEWSIKSNSGARENRCISVTANQGLCQDIDIKERLKEFSILPQE